MSKLISEQTIAKLQRKHLLLDTNFLLEATASPDIFLPVFQEFSQAHCQPIIFPLIDFEFSRNDFKEEIRVEKKEASQVFTLFVTSHWKRYFYKRSCIWILLRGASCVTKSYGLFYCSNVEKACE